MKSTGFVDYLKEEVFRDIPGIAFKAMFGGFCLYKDGKPFGLVANDILYFKVGDTNRADYEAAGSKPFTYAMRGKTYTMSYWQLPQEIIDDPDNLQSWMYKSLSLQK